MKVIKVKQVICNVVGKSPKKPKQLILPFLKKKSKEVQMTFNFNEPKKKLDKLA